MPTDIPANRAGFPPALAWKRAGRAPADELCARLSGITQGGGWGTAVPKNLAHVWTLELTYSSLPYNAVQPTQPFMNPSSFDFLVDDLQFY